MPCLDERLLELLRGELLLARDEARRHLEQHDVGAERVPRLRELAAHRAAADHDQALGDLVGGGGLAVGPGIRLGEARDRRQRGGRPGGDDDGLARAQDVVAGDHSALAVEPRLGAEELDAPVLEPRELD